MSPSKKTSPPPAPAPRASRAAQARAGIGGIMAGVTLAPATATDPLPRAAGAATPGGTPADAGRDAQATRALRHPVASGIAFERVENIYRMDPRKIVLQGPYIRQFLEDAAFHQLKAAVALEQDIGQHVGVRLVGPPTDQRRVLVYGMRRWKAALAAELDRIPVRDYGPISEDRAVELQMLENEIRADPHPVDTALGFFLLARQPEWNQKRIAQVFDKNKGYVSEMVRVGEAIAELGADERQPLYTAPRVTVRAFQSVAQIRALAERRAALLALLADAPVASPPDAAARPASSDADDASGPLPSLPSGGAADDAPGAAIGEGTVPPAAAATDQASRRKLVDEAVFHVRPLRNGRAFRVRWTDDDLRRDGARIAEEFRARLLEEYQHLLHRTAVLHGQVPGQGSTVPPRIADLVASAALETARVDARIVGAGQGSAAAGIGTAAPPTAPSGDRAG